MTLLRHQPERSAHGGLSHLDALEAESVFIMREVAAEFERPVAAVLGRQGLDRAAAPRREGLPAGALPVPGHAHRHRPQLPRGARVPRSPRGRAGRAADRRLGPGVDRQGPRARGAGQPVAQPAADDDPARRDPGAPVRRRVRRRAARRGEGTRQGARLLAARRVRPVGAQARSGPSCGASTTARSARASTCASSPSPTGPRWTSGSTSSARTSRCPAIYFAHERDVFRRDGMWLSTSAVPAQRRATSRSSDGRPLPHGRRHDLHRRGRRPTPATSRTSSWRSPPRGSPSAAPRAPTTRSARRPWKTASARATSNARMVDRRCRDRRLRAGKPCGGIGPALLHGRLGRRRQEHAHRAAAVRLEGHLRGPARGHRAHQPPARLLARSTWRC